MATEKLEIQIGADIVEVTKSIDQLERELQGLGKSLRSAVPGSQAFNDLSRAFTRQQAIIAGVNKEVAKTAPVLNKLNNVTGQTTTTLTNFGRVVQDAPFGIIGIANNIDPLISSFTQLKASTGSAGLALRALFSSLAGPAGIAIAVSTVTSALIFFTQNQQKAKKEVKETSDEVSNFNTVLSSSVKSVVEEAGKVQALVRALSDLTLSRKDQFKLINELKTLAPEYFSNLTQEKSLVDQLTRAYFFYKNSISQAIQAKLLEADLNRVTKKLEEVEGIFKRLGDQESLRKLTGGKPTERRGTFQLESGENLDINLLIQRRATLQSVILGIQNQINGSTGDYITQLLKGSGTLKEQVDILKEYKEALRLINFNEQALGIDLLNSKIDLASKTFNDFIEKGINPQSAAFQRVQTDLNKYLDSIKEINKIQDEIQKKSLDPTILNAPKKTNPINVGTADRTSSVVITDEALQKQGEYLLKIDEIIAKMKQFQEIGQVAIGGINAGIDQFFNALANNQDPFEALQQSVKRLVVELAAAVVKMLLLKAISAALTGGASAGLEGLAGGAGGGGLLNLVLRGDLLTGAIGGDARRRRGF